MHDVGKKHFTHGMTDSRLYRIYKHMLNRCNNPNDIRYTQYGGRGISICDEWNTFEKFATWANNNGYQDTLSIDRIDVNKDYSPENCRWSTPYEQSCNKTNTRLVTFGGKTQCIAEWAKELNMPYKKLWRRFNLGWDVKRALTT